jgi:hypothetical protein
MPPISKTIAKEFSPVLYGPKTWAGWSTWFPENPGSGGKGIWRRASLPAVKCSVCLDFGTLFLHGLSREVLPGSLETMLRHRNAYLAGTVHSAERSRQHPAILL